MGAIFGKGGTAMSHDARMDPEPGGALPGGAAAQGAVSETMQEEAADRAAASRGYVPRPTQSFDDAEYTADRPVGAALGFTITAAVLMMISGLWNFLEGLAAIIKGQFFVVLPNYVYNVSITGWGWIHLILGAAVFVAGAFLFMDKMWARIVGVVLACLSAVANFLYIPYSPVWSVIVIALDVFIVWALLAPRDRYAS
jgi:hypothetical protein